MTQEIHRFAQNLKTFRLQKGLTQKQMANHLRIGSGNIARYERAEVIPRLDVAIRIAALLEVSLNQLCMQEATQPHVLELLVKKALLLPEEKITVLKGVLKEFVAQ